MPAAAARRRRVPTATRQRRAPAVFSCPAPSVDLDLLPELLVLVADELDQLFIGQKALIDADGPRLRIRLRIFDRQIDLQVVERRTTEALGEFRLVAVRTAVHVH